MKVEGKCLVCKLFSLLIIVGAINWGLVGAFQYNLVEQFLGGIPNATRIVYILVGLAGLMKLVSLIKSCPCCKTDGQSCKK